MRHLTLFLRQSLTHLECQMEPCYCAVCNKEHHSVELGCRHPDVERCAIDHITNQTCDLYVCDTDKCRAKWTHIMRGSFGVHAWICSTHRGVLNDCGRFEILREAE